MSEGESFRPEHDIESSLRESIHALGNRMHETLTAMQAQHADSNRALISQLNEVDRKNIEKFSEINLAIQSLQHTSGMAAETADRSEKILTGNGEPAKGVVSQLQSANAKIDGQAAKLAKIERFWWLAIGAVFTAFGTLGAHLLEVKVGSGH